MWSGKTGFSSRAFGLCALFLTIALGIATPLFAEPLDGSSSRSISETSGSELSEQIGNEQRGGGR